jgi:chitin-binding protein
MSATAVIAPSPTPPAPRQAPPVTVAYSVVQRWDGGFQGQFTIVNHASTALTGWQIRAAFPGDLVDSAWGAGWQISGGGTLVLDAPSYQPTVPPGASQSANFTAQGNTTSPVNCTIDGLACGDG